MELIGNVKAKLCNSTIAGPADHQPISSAVEFVRFS